MIRVEYIALDMQCTHSPSPHPSPFITPPLLSVSVHAIHSVLERIGLDELRRLVGGEVVLPERAKRQSEIEPPFAGPSFVLAPAGIARWKKRLVIHNKAIETGDFIACLCKYQDRVLERGGLDELRRLVRGEVVLSERAKRQNSCSGFRV